MSKVAGVAESKSEETRARILGSALALFRKRGFEQTTMRQIAEHAGVAVGAAYYYFDSKDALVMTFYDRAQQEMEPLLVEALAEHKDFEQRLRAVLEVKFDYFGPNRSLLGALSAHADPRHPLSPFSRETRAIREKDIGFFARALEGSGVRAPGDLKAYLPRLLWMYQMGLVLFWVYDRSTEQARTRQLVDKSLPIIVGLIKLSSLPFLRPVRKRLVDLLTTVYSEDSSAEPAPSES
jgi:AcrR family transcriptional regulator